MPQSAEKVLDHAKLFHEPEYQELFKRKRETFECPASAEAGQRTTCEHCKLCAGASIAARNIAIVVHGTGASNWAH